ncbi:uncharacterized protein [Maniola hyperantus]|uniref:uncharacterized protein n=1 Tax=Aphantopus hyperantus TaxID=2795564 RepID=UPI003748C2A1
MTTELNVLHGKLKYLKEYVVKLGTKRNTELAYKKFQEAESIYQQSLKICFELEKQKLTISTSDKIVNNLVFEEIESFYRDIESLVTFRPKSNTERSKIAMASFDIKTAIALLPVMTGQEQVTQQLIDAIKLYSSMISEVSKPTLIEFVLKTRLSASGKLRLKSSYASTDDLIADMKKFLIQKKSAVALHTQLLRTNQGNKTIESFGTELEELFVNLTLAQADGNDDNFQILRPINEKIAIKRFADGLSDTRLSTIVASRQFDSLPEAIRTAIDEQLQSQQTYDVMTVGHRTNNYYNRGNRRGFNNTRYNRYPNPGQDSYNNQFQRYRNSNQFHRNFSNRNINNSHLTMSSRGQRHARDFASAGNSNQLSRVQIAEQVDENNTAENDNVNPQPEDNFFRS